MPKSPPVSIVAYCPTRRRLRHPQLLPIMQPAQPTRPSAPAECVAHARMARNDWRDASPGITTVSPVAESNYFLL